MALRAIAYLCKSSAPDSSFNAQLDRISAWCTQAGVTIVDDVQEDSWGSYASDSPMLSELLLRLDGGVAEMLLFTHPTFLSIGERIRMAQRAAASGRWIDVYVDDEDPKFDYTERHMVYEAQRKKNDPPTFPTVPN